VIHKCGPIKEKNEISSNSSSSICNELLLLTFGPTYTAGHNINTVTHIQELAVVIAVLGHAIAVKV